MLPVVRTSPRVVGPIHLHTLAQHNYTMLVTRIAFVVDYCSHGHEVRGSVDR
jgi:hypothetical protein